MSDAVVVQAVFGPDGRALTPEEFQALPRSEQVKARERGIRNQALGEGAKKEREKLSKEHKAALDAATLAYEHAASKAHKAGHAHGYHKAGWQFGIAGVVLGAVLACAAIFTMQKVIWDTATRSFREQAMTGALLSTHEERTPDYTQRAQP